MVLVKAEPMTLLTRTHDTWDESECLHLGAIFRIMQFTHRRPVAVPQRATPTATLHTGPWPVHSNQHELRANPIISFSI